MAEIECFLWLLMHKENLKRRKLEEDEMSFTIPCGGKAIMLALNQNYPALKKLMAQFCEKKNRPKTLTYFLCPPLFLVGFMRCPNISGGVQNAFVHHVYS